MRNTHKSKIKRILNLVARLPYFDLDELRGVEEDRTYLKIIFSRYEKRGKLIRLKKGLYTTKEYLDNLRGTPAASLYPELVAAELYQPSYLSLDYILYQHNLLTEIPINFTLVTRNKTAHFSNLLGNFFYHKIKDALFCGYQITKENNFIIPKATKAKALFDYLYLRKNAIPNRQAFDELRLNLDNFNKSDRAEIKQYIKIEKSKKMKEVLSFLVDYNGRHKSNP